MLVPIFVRLTVGGLVVLAVGSPLAVGGAAARQATPSPEAGLPAVVWQLTEITADDGTATIPDDPTMYTVQFVSAERAAVRADCNVGGGAYMVAGDQLTIGPLATTLAACAPGSLEGAYMRALERVASFSYEEDALVLTLDGEGGSLRFTPALTGVVWEWQRFLGGNDAEVTPDDPTMYTIEFLADGSVAVRVDCNQGRGTYTTEGAQLTIARLATTRVACPPESLSDRYVRDLQAVVTFVFREGRLALDLPADAGQLIFAARALEPVEGTPVAG